MPLPMQKIYTIDDIYALPDGERAELIDGKIYCTASPNRKHHQIVLNLGEMPMYGKEAEIENKRQTAMDNSVHSTWKS